MSYLILPLITQPESHASRIEQKHILVSLPAKDPHPVNSIFLDMTFYMNILLEILFGEPWKKKVLYLKSFSNLIFDCHPKIVKSREHSIPDAVYIQSEIALMLKDVNIELAVSLAQVEVITLEKTCIIVKL